MSIEQRISQLGIELPPPPKPVAAYVPALAINDWVYTAGQLPIVNGSLMYQGKLGNEISIEDGKQAARICVINALSAIKNVIGSLDRIVQIVKVVGFVNSAPGFTQQPAVINGASELLKEIFNQKGEHARSAVGVAELPLNSAVEIELIVNFKNDD